MILLKIVVAGFLGWVVGRISLQRELRKMTEKYQIACKAADTWRGEVEDLATRVREENNE